MSYTIEDINGCTKKLVFNFEQMDLSSEIRTALLAKQKESNLKGFRKGKAPLSMIEKLYRPRVENQALSQFVQNQFFEAVKAENIQAVGYPQFQNTQYDPGVKVSFEVTVEIMPEFELKDVSKLSFKQEKLTVEPNELEDLKKNYLSSKAEVVEVKDPDQPVATGYMAVINFEGEKSDGERPENMRGSEYLLEVGSNSFIPGFEDGLIGMKVGEKKTLDLTFPSDYHEPSLQGANVKFHTELLELKEKRLPEFSEEFAKQLGYESVSDFDEKTLTNLEKQKERQSLEKLHQEILEKLIEENTFDVPHSLVANQEEHVRKELGNTLKQQGFNDKMLKDYFDKWREDVTKKAEFQVRTGLILDKLSKDNNIEVSESDLSKKLEEVAAQANMPLEQVESFYKNNADAKRNMMYALREEKTFDLVKSLAKIS